MAPSGRKGWKGAGEKIYVRLSKKKKKKNVGGEGENARLRGEELAKESRGVDSFADKSIL